ncbi:MAG: peptidoglycan-binding protein [Christensenellales bacterium]
MKNLLYSADKFIGRLKIKFRYLIRSIAKRRAAAPSIRRRKRRLNKRGVILVSSVLALAFILPITISAFSASPKADDLSKSAYETPSGDSVAVGEQVAAGVAGYNEDDAILPENKTDSDNIDSIESFSASEGEQQNPDDNVNEDTPSPAQDDAASTNPVDSLVPGEHSEEVKNLQARLMELNYMDNDDPTDFYGYQTNYAVQLFQREHDLQVDGIIGQATYDMLFSDEAKPYTISVGSVGTDVEEMQKQLIKFGYLKTAATGLFGTDTEAAVKAFQKQNGLVVDGKIGEFTREMLYSEDAKAAPKPQPKATTNNKSTSTSKNNSSSTTKKTTPAKTPAPAKTPTPTKTTEKKTSTTKTADQSMVNKLIEFAKTQLGKRYVRGGKGPNTFDCSGFVYYCLNQIGYKIGYMTSAGWGSSSYPAVYKMSELQPGDIVCFKGHVGIYLGGGQMIDASSSNGKIRITGNMNSSTYWKNNFRMGRRVL